MKKIFLFISFFVAIISINAQNKSAYIEKLDSIIEYDFNGIDWEKSWYYKYNIDENGVFHNYKEFYFIKSENKLQRHNFDYQYDSKGNLTTESQSYFINNNWEMVYKTDYFYIKDTNLLLEKIQYRKDDNLENFLVNQKVVYHYDTNDVLIQTTDSLLNTRDIFLKYSTVNYTYNNAGNVIQKTELRWKEFKNDYDLYSKYEYTYLNDLFPLGNSKSIWDVDSKSWFEINRQEFHLDAKLNNIAVIFYGVDKDSTMVPYSKTEFQFDFNTEINKVAFPFYVPYFSNYDDTYNNYSFYNKPVCLKNYNYERNAKEWKIEDSVVFIYTDINTTSGLLGLQQKTTKAYPNPATDFVNFDLTNMPSTTEVQIFDINGKQVLKTP